LKATSRHGAVYSHPSSDSSSHSAIAASASERKLLPNVSSSLWNQSPSSPSPSPPPPPKTSPGRLASQLDPRTGISGHKRFKTRDPLRLSWQLITGLFLGQTGR
jgi:hypothetical protein